MFAERAILLAEILERALHLLQLLPELLQFRVAAGARYSCAAHEAEACKDEQRTEDEESIPFAFLFLKLFLGRSFAHCASVLTTDSLSFLI